MTNEFLDFVYKLMKANPELTENLMTNNIKSYLALLEENNKPSTVELTKNGYAILSYLQKNLLEKSFKSAEVAEGMGVSSRGISASMRKLVTDGFCNSIGKNPIIYSLTEKGKNYILNKVEE